MDQPPTIIDLSDFEDAFDLFVAEGTIRAPERKAGALTAGAPERHTATRPGSGGDPAGGHDPALLVADYPRRRQRRVRLGSLLLVSAIGGGLAASILAGAALGVRFRQVRAPLRQASATATSMASPTFVETRASGRKPAVVARVDDAPSTTLPAAAGADAATQVVVITPPPRLRAPATSEPAVADSAGTDLVPAVQRASIPSVKEDTPAAPVLAAPTLALRESPTTLATAAPAVPPRPAVVSLDSAPPPSDEARSFTGPTRTVSETGAIRNILSQYRSAFSALDVGTARAVWPSVDTKALSKAFDQLEEQDVEFDDCQIVVSGTHASASCAGRSRYIPKVGSKKARVDAHRWQFSLRRLGDDWLIDSVESR